MRNDRRTLLRRSVAIASALLMPRGASALAAQSERDAAADALVSTFANRTSAAVVGRSYLALRPAEADVGTLLRLIGGAPEAALPKAGAPADRATLKAAVRARVRDDFERGRVVALDGLVLSQCELRLCALAALRS